MKFLLVLVVVVLVLWAVRRSSLPPPPPPPPRRPEEPKQLEAMVRCSHCGLHLPRGEALAAPDGHLYCSPAHRAAGPRRA